MTNLLTVKQAAEYLNLPTAKVYELVRGKDFPAVKIGKSWRIRKDHIDRWLDGLMEDKAS